MERGRRRESPKARKKKKKTSQGVPARETFTRRHRHTFPKDGAVCFGCFDSAQPASGKGRVPHREKCNAQKTPQRSFDKDAVLTRVSHLSRCATRPQTLAGIRWTQEYWNKRATKKRLVLGQTRLNILMWTVGALARRREQHSALLPCPKL